MLFRAIVAFFAVPGLVALALPLAIARGIRTSLHPGIPAIAALILGLLLLLWCVREFYVSGQGTLAPWWPPQHLVMTGPYHYCRNPMYIGVSLMLVGWALLYRCLPLLLYAGSVAAAFHLRVVLAEEPAASRIFGEAWQHYARTTPRWVRWRIVR
ncbi:MAG TPA: methyltransferase [Steroidobacteraceae bacterium]|nr:methyltransferase [Steroidobacteraceae bacterium]